MHLTKLRWGFLIATLLACALESGFSQEITAPTQVKLEYWRAFHGVIKQEVNIVNGKMDLWTRVMRGMSAEDQKANTESTSHFIKPEDLKPLLEIFNDPQNRAHFLKTPFDDRLDGSSIAITVTQNQFSITFASQDALSGLISPSARLGEAAKILFKLGQIKIPEDELY